ncbi:MAG: FAD-dependent monooxygenase [Hyphomicrobiaceae bacterium]|nr:FAD-dependent monooxygenase [Hyphomicrobiaceae bacterium]
MRNKPDNDVLIVGAGPTGLVLAIVLARGGVRPRVIDKRAAASPYSRAIIVHARTLELYAALGLAETALALGQKVDGLSPWIRGKPAAAIELGDFGAGLSPYPFMLSLSQDVHERMLEAHLAALGVAVERGCELEDYAEVGDGVVATLRRASGRREIVTARHICGCDGFHSTTRDIAGIGFPGDSYQQRFFVADVHAGGPLANGRLNVVLGRSGFLAVFPLREEGWARVIGIVPRELQDKPELDDGDIADILAAIPRLAPGTVDWTSVYHVHHRVADRFRAGSAFLLGDAAHVHSPAGGQGMNTGIGDAFNLGWKLAAVCKGRAPERLLDSFEAERRPFAQWLLNSTDRAFRYAVDPRPLPRALRLAVLPRLVPVATRVPALRRRLFKAVSQTGISYRATMAGGASHGAVAAGDRLPWVGPGAGSHRGMDPARWHLVVCGVASKDLARYAADNDLAIVEVLPARGRAQSLRRDTAYLVRPDGHIACIAWWQQTAILEAYRVAQGLTWCGQDTAPAVRATEPAKPAKGRAVALVTPAAAGQARPVNQ